MKLFGKVRSLFETRLNVNSRFELLREAISGTMSEFYVARDRQTGEIVGLKILSSEKSAAFQARFKGLNKPSEGEIASAIQHEYVVRTFEHGLTTTGEYYLVMEFLEGPGLNSLILEKSKKLDGNRLTLIREMAASVQTVHEAGFIHRDVCPRNFICSPAGDSLKMIDFGLTVPAEREYMLPGNRTGTPNYMAPEIVRRRATDQRVDIFAMGVTAFQMCAFELPWPGGDNTGMAALAHDTKDPTDLLYVCPWLNGTLAHAIASCMSADPNGRPDSAGEFLQMIQRLDSEREA